jgi:hypothetical protein
MSCIKLNKEVALISGAVEQHRCGLITITELVVILLDKSKLHLQDYTEGCYQFTLTVSDNVSVNFVLKPKQIISKIEILTFPVGLL